MISLRQVGVFFGLNGFSRPQHMSAIMLRFFAPITADDARIQHQQSLASIDVEMNTVANDRRRAELLRPGPGRPRKLLDANKVLAAASVASISTVTCCISLFNVHDAAKRALVVEAAAKGEFESTFVPDKSEDVDSGSDGEEEDEEKDVLDVMKERQYGKRKIDRKRSQPSAAGYMLSSSQIALSEDSEA
jgi:hypothetical protein